MPQVGCGTGIDDGSMAGARVRILRKQCLLQRFDEHCELCHGVLIHNGSERSPWPIPDSYITVALRVKSPAFAEECVYAKNRLLIGIHHLRTVLLGDEFVDRRDTARRRQLRQLRPVESWLDWELV